MDKYNKMVVIFVDLLGTKNNERFEDKHLIHRIFHGEARTNAERNLNHVVYNRKVYSFSDCAYFFYYYKEGIEDSRKNDMKLLQIAMYNTANSMLRIMNAGYLVRGGITFGDAYFDELGFFGPAVEKAYSLESRYADVPIIALDPELGEGFSKWEESETNMELVKMLFTGRPRLVENFKNKYFLNSFYQLEAFSPSLILEEEKVEIESIKQNLFKVISRDKSKYKDNNKKASENKSTIYEKLDWMEQYLKTKKNHLNPDKVQGAFSTIFTVD